MDPFNNDWAIQPSDGRIDLIDAIDFILDFNESENENVKENEDENENVNEEKLMSSDKDDDDDDDETMRQNEIKKSKDYFEKIIGKSKLFEDQIESLKKSRKSKSVLFYQRF